MLKGIVGTLRTIGGMVFDVSVGFQLNLNNLVVRSSYCIDSDMILIL